MQTVPGKEIDIHPYLHHKKIKPPKQEEKISDDILVELKEEVFQHKHITRHTKNSTLTTAARVVRALRRPGGLSTILDGPQIELVVKAMSNGFCRLDPSQVRAILHKQFSEEDRIELYERLSNSLSSAYVGGSGKNTTLAGAVWSHGAPGFCRLVKVWLQQPQLKKIDPPTPKVTPDLEGPIRMLEEKLTTINLNLVLPILKELKEFHERTIPPMVERYGASRGKRFVEWFHLFLEFAYNKNEIGFHPGYLKINGYSFLAWEKEFREQTWREGREKSTSQTRARVEAEQSIREQEQNFREAYGI